MNRLLIPVILLCPTIMLADIVPEELQDGGHLYQDLCAECHADDGRGDEGVDIRGLNYDTLKRALRGVDEMPEIELERPEIEALVAYLRWLETQP